MTEPTVYFFRDQQIVNAMSVPEGSSVQSCSHAALHTFGITHDAAVTLEYALEFDPVKAQVIAAWEAQWQPVPDGMVFGGVASICR